MDTSILPKLKNKEFSQAVEGIQASLKQITPLWQDTPLQHTATCIEQESLNRLISDERMIEVWQALLKKSDWGSIALLNNVYRLRANWHFIKNGKSRNVKTQQDQYKKLRGGLLKFLRTNVGAVRYEQFEESLQDLDSFFEPRQLEKALYPKLPRKMNSSTSEDVYLQMRLVEEMYIYFKDANYRLVAIIVDVLLNKGEDSPTSADKVQHNTKSIADAFTGRVFDMKIND